MALAEGGKGQGMTQDRQKAGVAVWRGGPFLADGQQGCAGSLGSD